MSLPQKVLLLAHSSPVLWDPCSKGVVQKNFGIFWLKMDDSLLFTILTIFNVESLAQE